METPHVKVRISKLGFVKVNAECFTGSDCKTATAPVENAFRGATMDTHDKPEASYTSIEQTGEGEQRITN